MFWLPSKSGAVARLKAGSSALIWLSSVVKAVAVEMHDAQVQLLTGWAL